MSLEQAIGCRKHRQPVKLNNRWYYIWKLYQRDGETVAELTPYSIGHLRGFGYTTVPIKNLE